jgi:hypothetical protein
MIDGLDIKFYKLDGRWKGSDIFTWMCTTVIKPQYERFSPRPLAQSDLAKIIKFNQLRDWCWDTWGPSCDLKDYDRIHELSNYVSRSNEEDHKQKRIYLAGSKERTWLETRWR